MCKQTKVVIALLSFLGVSPMAHAGGKNVAVIEYWDQKPVGQGWCDFLTNAGHTCTVFPFDGPTAPLDPFHVIINLSYAWSDPTGMLADCMRAGKTVITWDRAPRALGVHTNPTVRAWIGATWDTNSPHGSGPLVTTTVDPILGNIPVGTEVGNCGFAFCSWLNDDPGHPFAKVLARFTNYPQPPPPPIGIMRNYWEGGVSVYLSNAIYPGNQLRNEIILNAVAARNIIPTVSTWGLLVMALSVLIAGTVVLRRSQKLRCARAVLLLIVACLCMGDTTARGEVNSNSQRGATYLRIGLNEPFHTTDKTIANLRSVSIPNSSGLVVLWDEAAAPNGPSAPFYAISLDGSNIDEVQATSYELRLQYAQFDPTVEQPPVPGSLQSEPRSELYIVQFVTQPLSAFRAAVEAQEVTIYDFLPNHSYVVRLPVSARAAVAALPFVRAIAPYHPAYRLEPFLRDNLAALEDVFPLQRYNIRVLQSAQKAVLAERIAGVGGVVDSPDACKRMVVATLTSAQLQLVARFDEVLFIDRWSPMEPKMDIVRRMPLRFDGSDQGLSKVVFASDKGQGFVRSGGVSAEGGGFVLDGVSIEEIESEVA